MIKPSTKRPVLRKARRSAASLLILPVLALGLASLPFAEALAADGTWTLDGSDDWTSGYNFPWNNEAGPVAEGADFTADFSTIDITANRIVTLTAPLTIGNLSFGDTSGSQTWTLSGSTLTLDTTSGTPTITNTVQTTINSTLAGNDGLTKAGGGLLILNSANTYTGTTTINAGTLRLLNNNAVNGDIVMGGGNLSIDQNSITLSSNISGSSGGTINKTNNSSTLTLLGNNTSNSNVSVVGNLVMGTGTNNGLGTGTLTLSSGGIRSLDNNSRTIANVLSFGSGSFTFGAASGATDGLGDLIFTDTGTRAVGGAKNWVVHNNTTVTFNNNFSGNPGHHVTKLGTGTLIFNGNLTFPGNTTVNNGTLILNGSKTGAGTTSVNTGGTLLINGDQSGAAGDVTVNANGTLGGTGVIGGATTVNGMLRPGDNGTGVLTFNNTLTLTSTAETFFEIDGSTIGVDYDSISVVGALTYGGGLTIDFGFSPVLNQQFTLFDFASAPSGSFDTVTINFLDPAYQGAFDGATGILTVTAIPEPATYAMLGLGVLALALLRRRRRAVRP